MMYYSSSARESAIKNILELNKKIANIPGKYLDFQSACSIGKYLNMLIDQIEKEEKSMTGGKN